MNVCFSRGKAAEQLAGDWEIKLRADLSYIVSGKAKHYVWVSALHRFAAQIYIIKTQFWDSTT